MEILRHEAIYLWYYFSIQFRQIFSYWVLGVIGIWIASALGIASPLCMYGTIPIAASFSKSGIKDDWLAAFMITGPATKITNLGAVKIVSGMKNFVFYFLFIAVFACLTGIVVNTLIL